MHIYVGLSTVLLSCTISIVCDLQLSCRRFVEKMWLINCGQCGLSPVKENFDTILHFACF